jgi:hypothetical protein
MRTPEVLIAIGIVLSAAVAGDYVFERFTYGRLPESEVAFHVLILVIGLGLAATGLASIYRRSR